MDFATVLDEAAELSADIKKGGNDSPLSLAVQRISVPLQDGSCAPAHCALSGQPVLVYESQDDPFREKLGQAILSEKRRQTIPYPNPDPDIPEPTFAFVCVPLIERGEKRGRTIGVLMCDNRFLPTEGKIDPECIWDIETFAAVAAMSIENDKLRRDLAERQELENWRFAVGLARHRLKGRPDIMDGAVKTIRDHLRLQPEANIVSAIEDSLRRLVEEIDRVKQTLREFEKFSAPATPDLRPLDLVKLLRDDIHFPSQSDCETELKLPEQALSVAGDKRLLTDVFTELIKNSCDAMAGDNEGCPKKITITAGLEQNSDGKSVVVVEFADTGPGIKAEPGAGKDWIFTPFKTTKEATGGNGLGLAIVAQDIRAHNGTIKFKETGRPGACFELRIPAFESGS
jgi:signal transduction histidine kinase